MPVGAAAKRTARSRTPAGRGHSQRQQGQLTMHAVASAASSQGGDPPESFTELTDMEFVRDPVSVMDSIESDYLNSPEVQNGIFDAFHASSGELAAPPSASASHTARRRGRPLAAAAAATASFIPASPCGCCLATPDIRVIRVVGFDAHDAPATERSSFSKVHS